MVGANKDKEQEKTSLMNILRHFEDVPAAQRGGVYALGNFDGVHLGHQQVIKSAQKMAAEMNAPMGLLVFEPHPLQFFFPDRGFFRLTSFRSKAMVLQSLGVDILAALPFDASMAERQPADFVMDVLVNGLHASHIVVGYDFRFGKGRAGDTTVLQYMGEMEGFGVTVVDEVTDGKETYSSTRIRELLAEGDARGAAKLLGRPWSIETQVIKGDQRGRTIGFPTANLSLVGHVEPAYGVYAVKATIEDGEFAGDYLGVANLGKRPTFDKKDVLLEVHIFDFDGDIYGAHIKASLIEFIRPERKFDGLDSLKAQISIDSVKAKQILAQES